MSRSLIYKLALYFIEYKFRISIIAIKNKGFGDMIMNMDQSRFRI